MLVSTCNSLCQFVPAAGIQADREKEAGMERMRRIKQRGIAVLGSLFRVALKAPVSLQIYSAYMKHKNYFEASISENKNAKIRNQRESLVPRN